MQFTLCENTGFFLRLGLIGPSGSGKTYTALKLATELGYERIAILDTENRSARRYARRFGKRFSSLELDHFSPRDYCAAIRTAYDARFEVLIIDSLSHAWMGKGGVLELVDQSAKRQARGGTAGSSFNGWREVTPEHNRLVQELVQVPMHLIVTMRVKTEYVVEKDQGGKAVPRKVGLAPVQRDGLEYEFDVVGDLSPEHELIVTKSRCPELTDAVLSRPGAELAQTLRTWLDGAAAAEPSPPAELTVVRDPEAPPKQPTTMERYAAELAACTTPEEAAAVRDRLLAALKAAGKLTPAEREEKEVEAQRRHAERAAALGEPLAVLSARVRKQGGQLRPHPKGRRAGGSAGD
jgi:hypothetical protein